MASNRVTIKILAQGVKQTRGQLKGLEKSVQDIYKEQKRFKFTGLASLAVAAGAGVAVVKGLATQISKLTQLSKVQEQAEAKLAAVIKSTGGAAGYSAGQMYDMASSLQSITTYGEEVIKEIFYQMLREV